MRFSDRVRRTGALAAVLLVASALPAFAEEPVSESEAKPAVDAKLLEVSKTEMILELEVIGDPESVVTVEATEYVKADESGFELDLGALAGDYATRGSEVCYGATMSKNYYNGFGNVSSHSEMYVEWCGQNGVITRVPTYHCSGYGAQGFQYLGCSKWRSSTGYSSVTINGQWDYRAGYIIYVYRTVTLKSKHYTTGAYSGTWTMTQ